MSEEMNDIEPEKKPKPSSINNAKKAREQRQRNVIEKKRKDAERYLKRTAGDENRSAIGHRPSATFGRLPSVCIRTD